MIDKKRLALFGYGKTTRAIAKMLENGCIFFDDNCKELKTDEFGNKIYPSSQFDAKNFDIEVTTPSIKPSNSLIKNAKNLYSEYDFFLSPNSPIVNYKLPFNIWISGTNGKTTTTQMLTYLLEKKGAVSGGNIGTPLADLDKNAPIWVLETSSFTLHHTKTAAPNIYLLLPITPDHLDWHGGAKAYEQDKLSPLTRMQEGELALVPKGLNLPKSDAWIVEYESVSDIEKLFGIDANKIKFKGAFLQDAILAMAVTKALFEEADYELINSFTLDAHRQEEIKDSQGRIWVNDSKATNVDAALQAIKVYSDKRIHLILGGDDKGVDLNPFFEEIKNYNIKIYAIGSNTQKLMDLSQKHGIEAYRAEFLSKAMEEINQHHTDSSIALLSPAAASLDQFKSYAQRGNEFKEFVRKI